MPYIDAVYDRKNEVIHVVERVDGQRVFKQYPAVHQFYYADTNGKFKNAWGQPVSRFSTRSSGQFKKELMARNGTKVFESDVNPIHICLEENYLNKDTPTLQVAYFDIETDFDLANGGFSPPDEAKNKITAISVFLGWTSTLITLAVPPKGMDKATAEGIASKFDNTFLFDNDAELLDAFISLVDDADILTGWNSEGFDIPYTVNRILRVLGKEAASRLCLWGKSPKSRMYDNYGEEAQTYDLHGRVHLDMLQLYKKFTYEERHSYSLDAIAEYELNERKVPYEGTLDHLYNKEFEQFLLYSRQDTALLHKLDRKLQHLELANIVSHSNAVPLATALGAVGTTDQAIINEAHNRGCVVQSRKFRSDEAPIQVPGGYVVHPKKGRHEYIGGLDIASLYPNTMRAVNMSPETIVGQLRPIMTDIYVTNKLASKNGKKGSSFAEAWEGMFGTLEYTAVMDQDAGTEITVDWEDGSSVVMSAAQVYDMIFNSGNAWILSANGTIFRSDILGIIPGLFARWYSERKVMQAKEGLCDDLVTGLAIPERLSCANLMSSAKGVDYRVMEYDKLRKLLAEGDEVALTEFCDANMLNIKDGKIFASDVGVMKDAVKYWWGRQQAKKINLNAAYGAILNPGSRFFDVRIGGSTTLSGRTIAKHMDATVNECLTGDYDHVGKAIIYGDTDSCIFSAWPVIQKDVAAGHMPWNKEICIELYDQLALQVNATWPEFMYRAFHCPEENGKLIKAGRELVGISGLFITKKRYAILIYDKEGKRQDLEGKSGKLKTAGLDLRRSDTPKHVQEFLKDILLMTLEGKQKEEIIDTVRTFKNNFTALPAWGKGKPMRVNNLTHYSKVTQGMVPGHVRAALNWNMMREMHHDAYSMNMTDGMKVTVCQLKSNPMKMTSIAFPVDEKRLPEWFKKMPFDEEGMLETVVDKKVENLLGVMKWDIKAQTNTISTFDSLFE